MFRFGRRRAWRLGVVTVWAVLTTGVLTPASLSARPEGGPDVVGLWTEPFEEDGSATPRCRPAGDGSTFVVCKPAAVQTAVLNDGRVFYYNGLESQENARNGTVLSLPPSSRDSQARVLDLRSGTPRWIVPTPPRGAQANPNVEPGHQSYDDPLGAAGVPGRPGDGFVGSTWGSLGGPPHDPTSSPDDPAPNDGDMFCADLTALPNVKILIAGGTDWYNDPSVQDRN